MEPKTCKAFKKYYLVALLQNSVFAKISINYTSIFFYFCIDIFIN